MRLKTAIMRQQEELLREKESSMVRQAAEVHSLRSDAARSESEVQRLQSQVESAHQQLEEKKCLLQSNQQVITWLNKEVNEAQLKRAPGGMTMGHALGHSPASASHSYRASSPLGQASASMYTTFGQGGRGGGLANPNLSGGTVIYRSPPAAAHSASVSSTPPTAGAHQRAHGDDSGAGATQRWQEGR